MSELEPTFELDPNDGLTGLLEKLGHARQQKDLWDRRAKFFANEAKGMMSEGWHDAGLWRAKVIEVTRASIDFDAVFTDLKERYNLASLTKEAQNVIGELVEAAGTSKLNKKGEVFSIYGESTERVPGTSYIKVELLMEEAPDVPPASL